MLHTKQETLFFYPSPLLPLCKPVVVYDVSLPIQAHLQQKRQKQAWLEGAHTSSGGLVMASPSDSEASAERIPPRLVRTLTQDAADGAKSGAGETSGKPRGTS